MKTRTTSLTLICLATLILIWSRSPSTGGVEQRPPAWLDRVYWDKVAPRPSEPQAKWKDALTFEIHFEQDGQITVKITASWPATIGHNPGSATITTTFQSQGKCNVVKLTLVWPDDFSSGAPEKGDLPAGQPVITACAKVGAQSQLSITPPGGMRPDTGPPKQASLDQLHGSILYAPSRTICYILTGNMYDDSALGFVYAKSNAPQNMIIQTDSTKINQTSGAPLFIGNVVVFGGHAASKVVNYYEGLGYARIGFSMNSTHFMFIQGSTVIYSVLRSTYDSTKGDYFVAQIYMDGSRTVFSMWGISHTGTYASGIYFSDVIQPNIASYTQSYLVCKWTDLNNDGIQQSNEITVVASGT